VYAALDTLARQGGKNSHSQVQGGKDRRCGRAKAERFSGFPENSYKGLPKGDRIPYKSCVDEEWAKENKYTALEDPPHYRPAKRELT
jgi:hypothetical protein